MGCGLNRTDGLQVWCVRAGLGQKVALPNLLAQVHARSTHCSMRASDTGTSPSWPPSAGRAARLDPLCRAAQPTREQQSGAVDLSEGVARFLEGAAGRAGGERWWDQLHHSSGEGSDGGGGGGAGGAGGGYGRQSNGRDSRGSDRQRQSPQQQREQRRQADIRDLLGGRQRGRQLEQGAGAGGAGGTRAATAVATASARLLQQLQGHHQQQLLLQPPPHEPAVQQAQQQERPPLTPLQRLALASPPAAQQAQQGWAQQQGPGGSPPRYLPADPWLQRGPVSGEAAAAAAAATPPARAPSQPAWQSPQQQQQQESQPPPQQSPPGSQRSTWGQECFKCGQVSRRGKESCRPLLLQEALCSTSPTVLAAAPWCDTVHLHGFQPAAPRCRWLQTGHWARECPNRHARERCFRCGQLGHWSADCPNR